MASAFIKKLCKLKQNNSYTEINLQFLFSCRLLRFPNNIIGFTVFALNMLSFHFTTVVM